MTRLAIIGDALHVEHPPRRQSGPLKNDRPDVRRRRRHEHQIKRLDPQAADVGQTRPDQHDAACAELTPAPASRCARRPR